jgi:hypothetical protein
MKKRIQLDALEIQSFVTSTLTNEQTREFNGGGGIYTTVQPGSGPCVECDVSGFYYSGDCGCDTSAQFCGGGGLPTTMFGGCIHQTTMPSDAGLSSAC